MSNGPMRIELMKRDYCAEGIIDVERHVFEAIDDSNIPKDAHGLQKGTFRITVEWLEDEDDAG